MQGTLAINAIKQNITPISNMCFGESPGSQQQFEAYSNRRKLLSIKKVGKAHAMTS